MVRFGMVGAALALMAAPLLAQESTEQLKKELQELRAEVDGLKAVNATREIPSQGKSGVDAMAADDSPIMTMFKGTKLSGYVDAGYQFSFNTLHVASPGATGNNPVRVFDNKDHSFYLNSVLLQLERLATKDMIVGYHIELEAGHNPSLYDTGAVALQEGWLQVIAPIGSGLDIRVGKMATLVGYEVVESVNDMNYSRGILFGQIQPITQTGIRLAYSFVEQVTATIGFSNGTNPSGSDLFADDDHGKMFEVQLALKPIKDLLIALTMLVGNDTANISGSTNDKFYLFDLVVAYTMDKLTLGLNFDKASAQGAIGANRAPLSGIAVYGKYQVNDWFGSAIRIEYFSDTEGVNGGLGQAPGFANDSGTGSRVFEFTLTQEFKVAQQMIVRFELRHDNSNNHNFVRDGIGARGDTTIGFEAILPF